MTRPSNAGSCGYPVVHIEPERPATVARRGAFPCWVKRDRYLYGDCALLALAVSARTGWPAVSADLDGNNGHVMAQLPDGRLLDAGGLHDPDTEIILLRGPFLPACWAITNRRLRRPDVQVDADELLRLVTEAEPSLAHGSADHAS